MNPDDFKRALLAALSGGTAPTPAPKTGPGSMYAALGLGLSPAPTPPAQPTNAAPYGLLSQLTQSSFADTLHAITGRPSVYTTASHGSLAGEYFGKPPGDTVSITGLEPAGGVVPPYVQPSPRSNDEWTLSHELGHKYAAAESERDRYDSRFLNAARPPVNPERPTYASVPNRYANETPSEYRAQAFANAVNFLRQTATLSPDATGQNRAAALRAKYDAEIPGTSGVVDDLLSKPIYRLHPLNMASMAVRPDATAVKRP